MSRKGFSFRMLLMSIGATLVILNFIPDGFHSIVTVILVLLLMIGVNLYGFIVGHSVAKKDTETTIDKYFKKQIDEYVKVEGDKILAATPNRHDFIPGPNDKL